VLFLGRGRGEHEAAPHHDPRLRRGQRSAGTGAGKHAAGGQHPRRGTGGRSRPDARNLPLMAEFGSGRPTLNWGMFCDYFMVDSNGKYSFIGVFERVGAFTFPAVHKTLYAVFNVRGTPNATGTAVVNIWTPDVTLMLSTQEAPVQFDANGRALLVHLLF